MRHTRYNIIFKGTTKNGLRSLSSYARVHTFIYIYIRCSFDISGLCAAYKTHMSDGKFVTCRSARVTGAVRQLHAIPNIKSAAAAAAATPRESFVLLEYCRSWLRGNTRYEKFGTQHARLKRIMYYISYYNNIIIVIVIVTLRKKHGWLLMMKVSRNIIFYT